MAGYPYYSPPPPSPPCNTTTPALQPPQPPPTACACNKTSPTLPPPSSPSPPPPPSTRYSPPLHSPLPPSHPSPASPPPPPFYYSPPPLPPSSSDYSPPPPSQSPPKPSKASPPPLLQPTTPPPAPSPYYSPQTPLHPPLAPDPPLCHCVCPSPWATPPNYYPSIAPSPQFLSPSNGHRTIVLTTFVSLGGVFFLAFITIGLLSMAIKKKIPSIPASTPVNHRVIDIEPNQKQVPPDQVADPFLKEETLQHTMPTKPPSNQSMTDKTPSGPDVDQQSDEDVNKSDGEVVDQESIRDDQNKKLHKSLSDQSVTNNIDAPQDAENESNECNRKPFSEKSEPGNANAAQDVGQGSNAVQEESNNSKARLRPPKKNPLNGRKGKKRKKKPSKLGQTVKAMCLRGYSQDDDDNEEEEEEEEYESHENEEEKDERNRKPFGNQNETENTTIAQDDQQESSTVEEKSNISEERLHPDDKNPSSSHKGKKLDQAVNAANNDHLDEAVQPQEDDKNEAEPQVDDEELKSSGSNKDSCGKEALVQHHQKRHTSAPGRQESPSLGKMFSTTIGVDPSVVSKSLADVDEKEEKEDQGMEYDDPSMDFVSLVDDGDKEEGFSLHKRQTGAGRRKEPPNRGQILTATTGSDPGVGMKSIATQLWASNTGESMIVRNDDDSYGKLESHDHDDGEGDLSVTATNEGDPNAGLEFDEEDEELESECSNKGLGLHKPHALSLGETEPSTDNQSVFVTGDDDPDESSKVARRGKPLSRPRTTGVRGKRRT